MENLGIPSLGYSRKKQTGELRIWNSQGYQTNCMRNFQGLIKNKMEFPEVIKNVEFRGVLVLGLKISKRCDNKILWSF